MHYYLYDTFLSDKKYEKVIDKIKTRLLDLEIQGKHEKLTLLKSLDELVDDAVTRGATSIIVLGNDKIFQKVVNKAAHSGVPIGIIPIGPNNHIAASFGIANEEQACDILAARKIVNFDLGKIQDFYFFTNVKFDKNLSRLTIKKDSYQISSGPNVSEVLVYNFYVPKKNPEFDKKMKKYSAQDNRIEIVFNKSQNKKGWFSGKKKNQKIDTIIQSTKFDIKSFEYLPAVIDDYKVLKTPMTVELAKDKLKVIVGKNRLKNIN
jgi:diacylglycerol kinase family enzyme